MTQTPPPPLDDVELRSIMMERLSLAVARGGLEMEEKLKNHFVGANSSYASFLFPSGPDHSLYKEKIAEYTKSPPQPPPTLLPPRQGHGRGRGFRGLTEALVLTFEHNAFTVGIPPGMMLKELCIMKFVAHFVARYGYEFRCALRSTDNSQFKFLLNGDTMSQFFSGLCRGYGFLIRIWSPACLGALLKGFHTCFTAFKKKLDDDGEEDKTVNKVETDRRDFVVCDEYFVDLENRYLPPLESPMARMDDKHDSYSQGFTFNVPPDPIFFRVGIPEGGVMRKELGIIKFTAMFVVRYGDEFLDALRERVCEPEFQFIKSNPGNDMGRYKLFSELLLAYGNVIKRWGMRPRTGIQPARMKAVLEGFFTAFNVFEKKHEDEEDEVVDTVLTDRRDFLVGEEYFQYFLAVEESTPLPEMPTPRQTESPSLSGFGPPLGVLMQRPLVLEKPEPGRMMRPPPPTILLREAKRGKLVPEDEFLAQHPGSSTITICVIGGVIHTTVQSLSETVGSLKEQIALDMGIPVPANELKLSEKTGLLKDDMSLAHYNLGAGEKLTMTF